jgi:hypothetical protein
LLPVKIGGLPAHVLLIHVVVVLVPMAAFMLVASAVWPAARAKLGFLTPAVALVALIFVPITTNAGHWLQDHLANNSGFTNPQIVRHAALGEDLWPWATGIFVMAAVVWVLGRRYDMSWRPQTRSAETETPDGRGADGSGATATLTRTQATRTRPALPVWVVALVAVVSIGVSVGGVVQLYRIGEAGAKAVWSQSTN